jgi:hypothetical protein
VNTSGSIVCRNEVHHFKAKKILLSPLNTYFFSTVSFPTRITNTTKSAIDNNIFIVYWRMEKFELSPIYIRSWCANNVVPWRMVSSGMLRHVALVRTDVSEEPSASFIRVTRIDELVTTLAATSNWCTLWRNTKGDNPNIQRYCRTFAKLWLEILWKPNSLTDTQDRKTQ